MSKRLSIYSIYIFSLLLVVAFLTFNTARAQIQTSEPNRGAAWHQTNYGTDAWGGTWLIGQFGPDIGVGEQGVVYEYVNPTTGSFVSYRSTEIGFGLGGPYLGYGGLFSPVATASYGPYAYGQTPNVAPTPGYDTFGHVSGNLWGQNTSYYRAQINPFAMILLGGLTGGYGGFGGSLGYGGFGINPYVFSSGFGRIALENDDLFEHWDNDFNGWYDD